MAGYQRQTAMSDREAIRLAGEYLPSRIPLERTDGDDHSITLTGGDGTARISAHRHGPETVVTAETDQLRTSRIDVEVQNYLNQLPYQPEDRQREHEV